MKLINIKPPYIALGSLILTLALHFAFKEKLGPCLKYPAAAGVFFIFGFSIMMWGRGLFKKKGTPLRPDQDSTVLVTEGPYRFSRNPIYLGIILMLLGIAFFIGTWPLFLPPLIFALVIHFVFIPHEENKMEWLFKEAYIIYKRKVRRWI